MPQNQIPEPKENLATEPRPSVAKAALAGAVGGAGLGAVGGATFALGSRMSPANSRRLDKGIAAVEAINHNFLDAAVLATNPAKNQDIPHQEVAKIGVRKAAFSGALIGALVGAVFSAREVMQRNHKEKPAQSHAEKAQQSLSQADSVSR